MTTLFSFTAGVIGVLLVAFVRAEFRDAAGRRRGRG
jgi:hypothetical protein